MAQAGNLGQAVRLADEKSIGLVEHFFRHETGRLHGALVRLLGVHNFSLAEDIAQEALLRALRTWSMGGIPPNPAAWITQVAMNLARDTMRHQRMAFSKEDAIGHHFEQQIASPAVAWESTREIRDDALRLMFVCCHPSIAADAQVILALKILCGFSTSEIARAFFSTEAAIEKQLTRTKRRIQDANIGFVVPQGTDLKPRLQGVLVTLYLLFNEGYKASTGELLIREELCAEAIRLTELVVSHPAGDVPAARALLALMYLSAARFPARTASGQIFTLEDQDRSLWNQRFIERGLLHLAEAARGNELTEYHLQAGIAACHCTAESTQSTDWNRILALYDHLMEVKPSPVVALNRAVALANVEGAEAGLHAVNEIADRERLEDDYLIHAVRGELFWRLKRYAEAAENFRTAVRLSKIGPEQAYLARKLQSTQGSIEAPTCADRRMNN